MNYPVPIQPIIFVLFGARGDLAHRLVVPALYRLHAAHQLPEKFRFLGVDREPRVAEEMAKGYLQAMTDNGRAPDPASYAAFAACLEHVDGDLSDAGLFKHLAERIAALDKQMGGTALHIYYLALPPSLFAVAADGLAAAGLHRGEARLVVEKPLGRDLASYQELEKRLGRHFNENQIYRIDHFLGKETAQNILALRFANPLFEPVWNRNHVDHVVITVAETLGVEHRAGYYEGAGALRDMVQNHLLQLLCLVAMEPPVIYAGDDLRNRRMDVLHALRAIPDDEVDRHAVRGQYGEGWIDGKKLPGYRREPGVAPDSNTETYAALKLFVDNWRWQDVPFYLRTGKRMAAPAWEISIRFRPVPHRAFPAVPGEADKPVSLILRMQPEESVRLRIYVKEPGSHDSLHPVSLDFAYSEVFRGPHPDAYETLIKDVIAGDVGMFMRRDQVEAAWRLVEPVLRAWRQPALDFPNYAAGSWGPAAADAITAADGHAWLIPDLSLREGR